MGILGGLKLRFRKFRGENEIKKTLEKKQPWPPLASAITVHDHGPCIIGSLMRSTWVGFERGIIEIEREYDKHGRARRAIGEEISCDFRMILGRVRLL